ncbi:nuclear transport factor 2 family protein [Kribbella capetownensis]|uniref:Nuclear transport factor 2 family protein n=1 Tax=Kribbella capetownensis TaxID=1572659 RepID=A0A4R0ILX8_9ACTN|nr:nuclear transport factor 2 family protein [Kribbella capetownensis]TCC34583.1 nuclear transport factor 2 family protein [Kribbella capetownensis]
MSELRAVIERMGQGWLGDPGAMDDLLADDVVMEVPFAPGGPMQWDGREEWLAFAGPARAGFPVRFDRFTTLALHETLDPEVAVIEYELAGETTATGERGAARFIGVLRVRDGKIAGWREYQNTAAIQQALG